MDYLGPPQPQQHQPPPPAPRPPPLQQQQTADAPSTSLGPAPTATPADRPPASSPTDDTTNVGSDNRPSTDVAADVSAPKHVDKDGTVGLPFPGRIGADGKHEVVYHVLQGTRKAALKDWCKEFHLPHSGNVAALRNHLEAFSANPQAWTSLLPGARISHKGPRAPGTTKSKPKQSTNRRDELMARCGDPNADGPRYHELPTERSKDRRTAEQLNRLLPWAENVAKCFPYHPLNATATMPCDSTVENQMQILPALQQHMRHTESKLADILTHVSSSVLVARPSASLPSPMLLTTPASSPPPISIAPSQPACAPSSNDTPPGKVRKLMLANGTVVHFAERDIPNPPSVSFACHIPSLNQMWDDTSEHWNGHSVLTIKGHPIAMIYWPHVYKYWKGEQWRGMKNQYSECKAVVERYRRGTVENFWAEFSVERKHMGWTAINQALRDQREVENNALAELARQQYGDKFKDIFTYRKKGQVMVLTKASSIAEHYRKLQNM